MNADSGAQNPYDAVLADLRQKRAQIDQAIAVLENLQTGTVITGTGNAVGTSGAHGVSEVVETAGMFLGMSIVDAAKKLLGMRKRTMSNSEILLELKSGGLVLTGADPLNVVGSVLTRRFNKVGDVVRVGRGIWGLKEWYPGRNFKPAKANGAEAAVADNEILQEETEEEANQRIFDELEVAHIAAARQAAF